MRLFPVCVSGLIFASILTLGVSCKTVDSGSSTVKAEHGYAPEGPLTLPGRKEVILIPNPVGGYVLLNASEEMKLTEFKDLPHPLITVDSRFGKFYILSQGLITVVDAKTGKATSSIPVEGENIGLAVDSEEEAYLYTKTEVKKISIVSGKTLASLTAPTEVFTFNDTNVFVAGEAEAQIIDKKTFTVIKSIKLEGVDEKGNPAKLASPLINASYQKLGDLLIVTGRSRATSSSSKGNYATIDLKSLQLKGIFTPPTFSGARIAMNKVNKLIDLQHTSTPVASTHAYVHDINADGSYLASEEGFMFDMFESTNTVRVSEDQTLGITVSRCYSGFCTPGKGLLFSDLKTNKRLPNFTETEIGFLPNLAFFAFWN